MFRLLKMLILLVMMISCSSSPFSSNDNISQNLTNTTPTPVKTPIPKLFELNNKLQRETDALLSLFDKMPPVPISIKDEPILKKGSETQKGVAYTQCVKSEPTIIMKKVFYEKTNEKQLKNILKHELTHAWLCRKGLMATGHGQEFRQKFKQVGGIGN